MRSRVTARRDGRGLPESEVRQYAIKVVVTIPGRFIEEIDRHIVVDRLETAVPYGTVRVREIKLIERG